MEALGQLAERTAHDFNNLLSVIVGNTELIKMELSSDSPVIENVQELEKATNRATDLTSQILSFARKQVVNQSVFSMNRVVLEMDAMLHQLLGSDVECVTITSDEVVTVRADRSQLEQVLVNLAINSRDAMPEGGTFMIIVRADTDGPEPLVHVTIRDTGLGMSDEVRDRAFEPFYTTKPIGKGTGLGLSTSIGIIERNGGTITIVETGSRGTTLDFVLPFVSDPEDSAREEVLERLNDGGSECILVVEDEDQLRSLEVKALRSRGYEVIEASNGHEAISALKTSNLTPTMLVTDVVMPLMGGPELARRMRESQPDLAILFVSGFVQTDLSGDLVQDGLAGFIQKPYGASEFAAKVRLILGRKLKQNPSTDPSQ